MIGTIHPRGTGRAVHWGEMFDKKMFYIVITNTKQSTKKSYLISRGAWLCL